MKSYLHIFIGCSFLVHVLVLTSFFRVIQKPDEECIREFPVDTADSSYSFEDFMDYDLFASMLAPYMDTAVIESLWQADSLLVKEWRADMPPEYNAALYEKIEKRSRELRDLLEKYLQRPDRDSLFAQSAFLRDAVMKQILKHLSDSLLKDFQSDVAWEDILADIAEFLKKSYGSKEPGAGGNRELFSRMVTNPELMRLWKEAMHSSLQDEAMARMRDIVHRALKHCMDQCGFSGSGGSGTKELGLPGSGEGGAAAGIGAMPDVDFEQCFKEALQKMGGPGASLLRSLLTDDLLAQLGSEAHAMAFTMLGKGGSPFSLLRDVNFARAIKEAFGSSDRDESSMRLVEDFMETIRKGLGEDITGWFAVGPTPEELEQNPYYYEEWAREYLDLVHKIATTPNLLVPNLNKYAEAAQHIRDRYLSNKIELGIGKGITAKPEEGEYYIPRKVYLPRTVTQSDTVPAFSPLVKSSAFTHAWGGAARAVSPIVLDGRLNEWQQCKPYALCGSGQGLSSLPPYLRDCNCLWVQWDNRGFYFAYQINDVRDNSHRIGTFWDTDALEIFLDPHNHKDPHRVKGRSFQFWVWPRAQGVPGSTGESVFSSPHAFHPRALKKGLIRFASIRKGKQYTCEVFVPALLCEPWYPLPGKIIGFNYSINNGEGVLIRWVTNKGRNISVAPDLWGDLVLMGSDALMRLSPEEVVFPGQNLIITITDHDMNLKAHTRDKIWIKVASHLTEDKLPLALVETDENSGVFTTEVGTVFALRPKEKDRMSVRPGDILTVYYLDQHASGGRKNIPVVREINVGRGVFSFGDF